MNIDNNLYYLIFGESILNDAVALILFGTFASEIQSQESNTTKLFGYAILKFILVFLGSFLIGIIIGVLTAFILKNLYN